MQRVDPILAYVACLGLFLLLLLLLDHILISIPGLRVVLLRSCLMISISPDADFTGGDVEILTLGQEGLHLICYCFSASAVDEC